MKGFLKTLGMVAAAGAISGAAQWTHGQVDPAGVLHGGDTLHQLVLLTSVGAVNGVIGLWTKKPGSP